MAAYYNEIDPAAAAVLRELIASSVIAPGDVDTRSIKEVSPDDIKGYAQCHFFAGGGLWSVAARLAGWPDSRPLWTGSCPCQPFSAAGKGRGTDDPRHLWPDFHRLIRAARPPVVMGEQVAGAAGYGWFDGVGADLEAEGYTSRAVDFPACAIDAPHQRNRLYWVAVADGHCEGLEVRPSTEIERRNIRLEGKAVGTDYARSDVANCPGQGRDASALSGVCGQAQGERAWDGKSERLSGADSLHAGAHRGGRTGGQEGAERIEAWRAVTERDLSRRNGTYWSDAEWIICHDGKARRAQSGLRLLVDGLPGRVDLWRIAGNAIVPQAAAEVITAFMECYP